MHMHACIYVLCVHVCTCVNVYVCMYVYCVTVSLRASEDPKWDREAVFLTRCQALLLLWEPHWRINCYTAFHVSCSLGRSPKDGGLGLAWERVFRNLSPSCFSFWSSKAWPSPSQAIQHGDLGSTLLSRWMGQTESIFVVPLTTPHRRD